MTYSPLRVIWTALILVAFSLVISTLQPQAVNANSNPIKIDFQLSGAPTPNGYLADTGQTYGNRGNGYSYGWNSDHTDVTRDRNVHSDQRLDTLIHVHQGKKWEISIPNNTYEVYVVIGDPSYGDTRHTLSMEGVNFWNDKPLGANEFAAMQRTVTVNDGKMTLTVGNAGENQTKISFLQILPRNTSPSDPISNAPNCNAEAHLSGTIQSDNRTGRITNSSSNCSYEVGMAAYRKFDEIIDNQEIFHSTTATIGPNQSINLTVNLPNCATQVDLFYGPVLQSLNGQRYGERLLAAKHINGTNYCAPPACPDGTIAIEGVTQGQNVSGVLNIKAVTSGPTSRVVFNLTGASSQSHTENIDPYYFLGDTNGAPNGWNTAGVATGQYTMTAVRYAIFGQSLQLQCGSASVNFCVGCNIPTNKRVFIQKLWTYGPSNTPGDRPGNLPNNFQIVVTSSLGGTATCTYPSGSPTLSCVYNNAPTAPNDTNGLLLAANGTYTVTEINPPAGNTATGVGGPFVFSNANCSVGFGGDANACQHTVVNNLRAPGQ
jgi:hypothetical protein